MTLLKGNPYTTVIVNDTIHEWELHEDTHRGSKMLQVLKPKPQVKEGNINDEKNSYVVKITADRSFHVFMRKKPTQQKHQLMKQCSITRQRLIENKQITLIEYDEERRYVNVVI